YCWSLKAKVNVQFLFSRSLLAQVGSPLGANSHSLFCDVLEGGKYQEKRTQCCQWPVGMKGLSQRDAAGRNKSPTKEGTKTS
ncbi:hypothetical protein CIB84_008495, partial [Bambusicola thoracicus]